MGAIGNQYARFSEIMASGMATDSPEWQIFTHARPGTVDTSAVPNDQVHNPGTMNAILNMPQRPTLRGRADPQVAARGRPARPGPTRTPAGASPASPASAGRRAPRREAVHHILKGGEDSIGAQEAVQRVYFNIGSCSEECWVNHLTDLRQIDPQQRGFGQTPFDIGQCRRDCPNFRAIEDRLEDVAAFLHVGGGAGAPTSRQARGIKPADLVDQLEKEHGAGRGGAGAAALFATQLRALPLHAARALRERGLRARRPRRRALRVDWLGNDAADPVSEVGTFPCRALHSNHMEGHVWQEYGSETYRVRPADADLAEPLGRRPRLLPQHLAPERLGPRALHAQQRDRSRAVRPAQERRRTTSTARPTWTRTARPSPRTRPRPACPTTRASRAASRSTRPRWRAC